MKFFVGKESSNNVPLSNGKVLAHLQQYDQNRPVDRIHQLFYPYFDRASSVLGDDGIYSVAKDSREGVWYDPCGLMRGEYGEGRGYVSIDNTRFVDGTGVYEVVSHKGFNRVRTTTWVSPEIDVLVRRIEVSSHLKDKRQIDLYTLLGLRGEVYSKGEVIIAAVTNHKNKIFVAIHHTGSDSWKCGEFVDGPGKEFGSWQKGMAKQRTSGKFSFHSRLEPVSGSWSKPVYLVIGFGESRKEALKNLEKARNDSTCLYKYTLDWWTKWLRKGFQFKGTDKEYNYLLRLSLVLQKMCIQHDGMMGYAGFEEYQGNVWIRDSIWVAISLARSGHLEESLQILRGLKSIVKKRPDGNFRFAYDCRTKEHTELLRETGIEVHENDSMGLLIAGIWNYYEKAKDRKVLEEFWSMVSYAARWICANRDETGMIFPCCGIWETFGPHLGKQNEHMVWTSGISAYGLRCASRIAGLLRRSGEGKQFRKISEELVDTILKKATRDGVLCRSLETDRLDASVLTFFTLFPLFDSRSSLLRGTVRAIEKRLIDPVLGGVWRHEDAIFDAGDTVPWHCCTLWLVEVYLLQGKARKARSCLEWVLDNSSFCGLIPECMLTREIARGVPMPSFSQGGLCSTMLRYKSYKGRT